MVHFLHENNLWKVVRQRSLYGKDYFLYLTWIILLIRMVGYLKKSVEVLIEEGIAIVFLNEPDSLNALTKSMKESLNLALDEIENNDAVKVVIFTGRGRAFCAGGDVKAMTQDYNPLEVKNGMDISANIINRIRKLAKITISGVNGYAAGAGMSLAIAADFVIAEEKTTFFLSFKNVGLIPDLGLHYHLPRMVGEWKAKEWMWKGKKITAQEAKEYGLVLEVVSSEKLLEKAIQLAKELIDGPIQSYIFSKLIINSSQNVNLEQVMEKENHIQTIIKGAEEHKKAVELFFAKK